MWGVAHTTSTPSCSAWWAIFHRVVERGRAIVDPGQDVAVEIGTRGPRPGRSPRHHEHGHLGRTDEPVRHTAGEPRSSGAWPHEPSTSRSSSAAAVVSSPAGRPRSTVPLHRACHAGERLLEPRVRLLHLRPPALRKAEAPGDDGERLQIGAGGAREIGGGVKAGDGFRGLVQPAAHPLQPDRRAPVQPAGCHDDRAGAGVEQPLPRGAEEHGRHRVEVRWTGDHEADLLRRRELVQAGGRVLCRERIESHPHAGASSGAARSSRARMSAESERRMTWSSAS